MAFLLELLDQNRHRLSIFHLRNDFKIIQRESKVELESTLSVYLLPPLFR